jgi:hypothetical protein
MGGYCETLHLTGRNRAKFTAMKVPRHCTLVLLEQVEVRVNDI